MRPGESDDLEPVGILLPADNMSMSASLEIHLRHISDNNATGYFSVDVDQIPTLQAGETSEFVVTRAAFDEMVVNREAVRGGDWFKD